MISTVQLSTTVTVEWELRMVTAMTMVYLCNSSTVALE